MRDVFIWSIAAVGAFGTAWSLFIIGIGTHGVVTGEIEWRLAVGGVVSRGLTVFAGVLMISLAFGARPDSSVIWWLAVPLAVTSFTWNQFMVKGGK